MYNSPGFYGQWPSSAYGYPGYMQGCPNYYGFTAPYGMPSFSPRNKMPMSMVRYLVYWCCDTYVLVIVTVSYKKVLVWQLFWGINGFLRVWNLMSRLWSTFLIEQLKYCDLIPLDIHQYCYYTFVLYNVVMHRID